MVKRKRELTEEERLLAERERELDTAESMALQNLSEPTYFFQIGDKVRYGNLKNCTVTEILHDGKIYVLRCLFEDFNHPDRSKTVCRVVPWTDLRPLKQGSTSFTATKELSLEYNRCTVESLLRRYYFFGIDTDPVYQRDYVWEDADRENLFDSIFYGMEIGKFVLNYLSEEQSRKNGKTYEIVDGKQRLITMVMFYENRLAYRGVYFNDLSFKDQNTFLNKIIEIAEITDADYETILKQFVLINQAGKCMDPAHLDAVRDILKKLKTK